MRKRVRAAYPLNLVFNTGVTLLLGLGFDYWAAGFLTGGVGLVMDELVIFTQPTVAADALEHYRAGDITLTADQTSAWNILPTFSREYVGATFTYSI